MTVTRYGVKTAVTAVTEKTGRNGPVTARIGPIRPRIGPVSVRYGPVSDRNGPVTVLKQIF